jgi:hypothetical protein
MVENDCEDQGFSRIRDGCTQCRVALLPTEGHAGGWWWSCPRCRGSYGEVELRTIPVSPNDDYRAGADGRIYSRTKYKGFGRKVLVDWYPLAGHINDKGYLTISLCHANVKVTKSVHTLVAMAFHGPCPEDCNQVRHLDGKRQNNVPWNLRWGTGVEQWQDRRAHGTDTSGEDHWASKFSDAEREHIRWAVEKGLCSKRHAAVVLGVAQSTIQAITFRRI